MIVRLKQAAATLFPKHPTGVFIVVRRGILTALPIDLKELLGDTARFHAQTHYIRLYAKQTATMFRSEKFSLAVVVVGTTRKIPAGGRIDQQTDSVATSREPPLKHRERCPRACYFKMLLHV